jgi:superfamily II DNA/RNA helicase
VFNFDVPSHAEDYVHRIGRTGRAGRLGKAFTLAVTSDQKYIDAIEHMIQRPLPRGTAPDDFVPGTQPDRAPRAEDERSRDRGRGGDRSRDRSRGERGAPSNRRPERVAAMEPVETVTAAQPEAQVEAAPEKVVDLHPTPARKPAARDDRRERRGRGDDAPVVGMGDHVPDFLMRSFRSA